MANVAELVKNKGVHVEASTPVLYNGKAGLVQVGRCMVQYRPDGPFEETPLGYFVKGSIPSKDAVINSIRDVFGVEPLKVREV